MERQHRRSVLADIADRCDDTPVGLFDRFLDCRPRRSLTKVSFVHGAMSLSVKGTPRRTTSLFGFPLRSFQLPVLCQGLMFVPYTCQAVSSVGRAISEGARWRIVTG